MMNEKAVVKAIKAATKSGSRFMIQITEEHTYMTNGLWAFRLKYVSPVIVSELVKVFGKIPQVGDKWTYQFKSATENGPDIQNIFPRNYDTPATLTKITLDFDKETVRIIRTQDRDFAAINSEFVELIPENAQVFMKEKNSVVMFNDELIMMPIARKNTTWKQVLQEQLGDMVTA